MIWICVFSGKQLRRPAIVADSTANMPTGKMSAYKYHRSLPIESINLQIVFIFLSHGSRYSVPLVCTGDN